MEDAELRNLVHQGVDRFEEFLREQIQKAIDGGDLDRGIDFGKTASVLITYMQGLMKLCVLDYSDPKFREQTEYFLNALGL